MSIDLNRIALAYGARTLLHEASASLPAGSLTALIGRNGAGKKAPCCGSSPDWKIRRPAPSPSAAARWQPARRRSGPPS